MQHRVRKQKNRPDKKLRQHMWDHMTPDQMPFTFPQFFGNLNVRTFPQLDHLRPDNTGQRRPVRQSDPHSHPEKSSSQCHGDQDQKQDMRDPQHKIDQKGYHSIHFLSKDCSRDSQYQCDPGAHSRRNDPKPDTERKSPQRPCKHISPHPVCAKWMCKTRRDIFRGKISRHRRIRKIHPSDSDRKQKEHRANQPDQTPFSHRHLCAPPFRIRRSTSPYKISAVRFPAAASAAQISVTAIKSGISLPSPACTAACPNPG